MILDVHRLEVHGVVLAVLNIFIGCVLAGAMKQWLTNLPVPIRAMCTATSLYASHVDVKPARTDCSDACFMLVNACCTCQPNVRAPSLPSHMTICLKLHAFGPHKNAQAAAGPQMSVMDGNLYDTRFQEAGQELDDDLEAALLLLNNRQQPLLAPGGGGQHSSTGKVLVQLSVSYCSHGVLQG